MPPRFTDTLGKYSNAAVPEGSDKDTDHSYGELYDDLLARYVDLPDVAILEVGVLHGAFLQAVAEFLPRAQVHGLDISLAKLGKQWDWTNPRIHTHEADGTLPSTALRLGTRFDLIIEDASHLPAHQVETLDAFAPFLKPGGVYVVEDIDQYHADYVRQHLTAVASRHGLAMEWMDLRHRKQRFDDIIAVLTRPE